MTASHPSATPGLGEGQFFTLVFKGDIRKLDENPFHIATPYGLPFAAGIGNAFEHHDDMLAALKIVRRHAELIRLAPERRYVIATLDTAIVKAEGRT